MTLKAKEITKSIEEYNIVKMVIQKHFNEKGIMASFVPKINESERGNNLNAHFTLWKID